ncbi:NmrA-like family [Teratosphaeria destructans]|uniref:NmrA-like family n=1 Tax=Teratosphaeria destructans TaxID=418781 RepID=A0A9W7SPK3_9PEZI|nr:NmrA-like family [Teratosphaeria destructans]
MLAIVGASGKLGFASLNALLDHGLMPPHEILCTTSSDAGAQKLKHLEQKGVTIKRGVNWDSAPGVWEDVLSGVDKLFLISSARIEKDFGDAPPGEGREADHFKALDAAKKTGVQHVYYTSLAFANPSKSRVMKAHERTEEWLRNSGLKHTIIREGLYNESWPLYFGHYDVPNDDRTEVPVAGDGKISWTSIPDLGLANAMILAAPSDEWTGQTLYLAQEKAHMLAEVAKMVSGVKDSEVVLKIVPREEHEKYYVQTRGMDEGNVKWWSKTYDALRENECEIHDPTLEKLLGKKGQKPKPLEETVEEMLQS